MFCVALAMFLTLSVLHSLKFKTLILDIQTLHDMVPSLHTPTGAWVLGKKFTWNIPALYPGCLSLPDVFPTPS